MKTLICFYSLYGHVYTLAKAVAEGVDQAGGNPVLKTVQETLPSEVLTAMNAAPDEARGARLPVASIDDLVEADAIIFGTPTRFGGMCAQMRAFLDRTGGLWAKGSLVGKVGSAFTSSATQHGGQETTIFNFHTFMLHHGMLIGGAPFTYPGLSDISAMSGGSPYGAGTIAGSDASRVVSENELGIARHQGKFIAEMTKRLVR